MSSASRKAYGRAAMTHVLRNVPQHPRRGKKLNKRQKSEVKRLIGGQLEHKYFSYGQAGTAVTSTPGIYNMSLIPQGSADQQRVGDSINLKKLVMRFQVVGGDIYNTFRCLVIRYRSDTGTAPAFADIFDTTATGAEYVLCPVPAEERGSKIQVIYDKVVTLPQTNYYSTSTQITQTSGSVKTWKATLYGRRLGPKKIRYNPGATSSPNGAIYLVIVSDSIVLPNPSFYINARLEYTDA